MGSRLVETKVTRVGVSMHSERRDASGDHDGSRPLGGCATKEVTRARADADRNSDERLLALVRRGDDAAFERIVERYRSPLLRHCKRVAGDSCAQDALQQTFFSAWRALRSDCVVHDLRPWLFTIAHRSALQASRECDGRLDRLPATLSTERSCAQDVEQNARAREALAAVAALPALERDALVWTAIHGRSGRLTARSLGVTEQALRQLVFRARRRARAAVNVFLPPALLPRLSDGARRVAALGRGCPDVCSPEMGGMLLKIAAVVAAGALLGARTTVSTSGDHRSPRAVAADARTSISAPAPEMRLGRVLAPSSARRPVVHRIVGTPLAGTDAPPARTGALAPSGPRSADAGPQQPEAVQRPPSAPAPGGGGQRLAVLDRAPPVPVAGEVTSPGPQQTAPLRQITAPVKQVVAVLAPLPQTIATAASDTVQAGTQRLGQVSAGVDQQLGQVTGGVTQQLDQTHSVLGLSSGSAPVTTIKSLIR
ncbi:MAG: hypothetical protein QOC91_1560 [Solirubrobacteraceae bacterium]|nr:hypothetical protein [Solirubrobacteraceae bacterium]